MEILVPVGVGELVDKLTILDIKRERIHDEAKRKNVAFERACLQDKWQSILKDALTQGEVGLEEVERLQNLLAQVNGQLWDVEDKLRVCESKQAFDSHFIELARSVYKLNDQRAAFKKALNQLFSCSIIEEKSYSELP